MAMQLTRAADYALRVMIHLAGLPAGSRVSRESLASDADVPAQFLGKVLQSLSRAELIKSYRGAMGGFQLARPASAVSALDVVEALEGPLCLNVCLASEDSCPRQAWCSGHAVWREAQNAMEQVLRRAVLSRLAAGQEEWRESVVKAAGQGTEAWNSPG